MFSVKNKFKVKHIKRFSLEISPFDWLQTLLNISGIRLNLLYDLLKSSELRDGDMEAINPRGIISIFLLLPMYFPLALVLSVLESLILKILMTSLCLLGIYTSQETT